MKKPMHAFNPALKVTLFLCDRRSKKKVPHCVTACRSTFRWQAMLKKCARR
jgi:hypothetical protein